MNNNEISKRVKSIRKKYHLSQEKLAQHLGVSFATVNRWENCKVKISSLALQALDNLEIDLSHKRGNDK